MASTKSKATKKVYTITYGDVAENHARMQKIGELHAEGYSLETLEAVQTRLEGEGINCEMYALHDALKDFWRETGMEEQKVEEARAVCEELKVPEAERSAWLEAF